MNLDNYTITGIHTAFEEVKRVAKVIIIKKFKKKFFNNLGN